MNHYQKLTWNKNKVVLIEQRIIGTLCRKTTVLSCHRCLISICVEKTCQGQTIKLFTPIHKLYYKKVCECVFTDQCCKLFAICTIELHTLDTNAGKNCLELPQMSN